MFRAPEATELSVDAFLAQGEEKTKEVTQQLGATGEGACCGVCACCCVYVLWLLCVCAAACVDVCAEPDELQDGWRPIVAGV